MNKLSLMSILTIILNVNSYSMNAILKAFNNIAIPLHKIDDNPFIHDFMGTRRSNSVSGYDMRNVTDKIFEYREIHDKGEQLKKLLKIKLLYHHPGGDLTAEYEKNELSSVNIKNGGLLNDFNDCLDDCQKFM